MIREAHLVQDKVQNSHIVDITKKNSQLLSPSQTRP